MAVQSTPQTALPTVKTRAKPRMRVSISKVNYLTDAIIALAFVLDMEFRFTGLRNHELIGVALTVIALVHIVLHWRWILNLTLQFFRKLFHESRLNYLLNMVLFAAMGVLIVSGFLISRTLGLNFGLDRGTQQTWQRLHTLSADITLIVVALHVAMHWKWIIAHTKKYLIDGPRRAARRFFSGGRVKRSPIIIVRQTESE